MPVTIEQLPKQPILVVTVTEPFNPLKEQPIMNRQFQELVANIQGTIYQIVDTSGWKISFDDLVNVLAAEARGGVGADPRVRTVVVGSGEMVSFGVKAAKQRQYGAVENTLFSSMDEALAYINAELAKQSA